LLLKGPFGSAIRSVLSLLNSALKYLSFFSGSWVCMVALAPTFPPSLPSGSRRFFVRVTLPLIVLLLFFPPCTFSEIADCYRAFGCTRRFPLCLMYSTKEEDTLRLSSHPPRSFSSSKYRSRGPLSRPSRFFFFWHPFIVLRWADVPKPSLLSVRSLFFFFNSLRSTPLSSPPPCRVDPSLGLVEAFLSSLLFFEFFP